MSILKVVPAIFFTLGVSIAIINVDGLAIELLCTNDYTYLPVASNFVYIKLKSEGSTKIALTDTPFPSPLDYALDTSTQTQFVYEFYLHDSKNDVYDFTNDYNMKSHFAVNRRVKAEVETPGIFSGGFEDFVEILIYWNSNYLVMSRIGDQFPLFYWKDQSFNLQSIKYVGVHIHNPIHPYGSSPILKNQWMINFLPHLDTSYAFGETVTKPTLEDKERSTRTPESPSSLNTRTPRLPSLNTQTPGSPRKEQSTDSALDAVDYYDELLRESGLRRTDN